VIEIDIAWFARDMTNLFSKTTQQHTDLPTNAMTAMMTMMKTTMLPPPATPHCPCDPVDPVAICHDIALKLA